MFDGICTLLFHIVEPIKTMAFYTDVNIGRLYEKQLLKETLSSKFDSEK